MPQLRSSLAPIALAFGLCIAAGCGGDPTAPDTTATVAMRDNTFNPTATTVSRGATVRWTNEGAFPHNTTASGGAWQSADLNPGQTFDRRFDTAGTFGYACTLHAGMTGTVVVQ